MTYTPEQIAERDSAWQQFNATLPEYRANGDTAETCWQDATNCAFGPYPGSIWRARRTLAPWRYVTSPATGRRLMQGV